MLTNQQQIFDISKQFFPDTITGQGVDGGLIIYLMNPKVEMVSLMGFMATIGAEPGDILLNNGNLVVRLPPALPQTMQTLVDLCPEHFEQWTQRALIQDAQGMAADETI